MLKKFGIFLFALALVAFSVWLGKKLYLAPKLALGAAAEEFQAPTLSGDSFRLSDLRGKIVLLDFWASWCGPCRRDNPTLTNIWREFSGPQFTIVSVSLDEDRSAWAKAIQKDGLDWPYHVSHLKGFDDPVALQYGVKSIPTKYLLSEEGTVIAVNPSEEKLQQLLRERLGK